MSGSIRGAFADTADFARFALRNPALVAELARKEIRGRYLGSYLGIAWAFVQPLATILIFWFLFAIGLRTGPARGDVPFILWLVAGMVPWFFLNDAVNGGAGSIADNSYLVKKVSFRVGLLPPVRVLAALFNMAVLSAVMVLMFLAYRYPLSAHALQVFYYAAGATALATGLSLLLGTLAVFVKDVKPVTAILMQFAFWLTAVFWSVTLLPARFRFVIRLNPFSYVVEGFREALIDRRWFWESHPGQTAYFWGVTAVILVAGILVYRRLRPSFADHV